MCHDIQNPQLHISQSRKSRTADTCCPGKLNPVWVHPRESANPKDPKMHGNLFLHGRPRPECFPHPGLLKSHF